MHRSVLFDIIVFLHGSTISANCIRLIENKNKVKKTIIYIFIFLNIHYNLDHSVLLQ